MNTIHYPIDDAYSSTTEDLFKKLNSNTVKSLFAEEVENRWQLFGKNIVEHKKKKNLFLIFLSQFVSPMVYMLLTQPDYPFFLGSGSRELPFLL